MTEKVFRRFLVDTTNQLVLIKYFSCTEDIILGSFGYKLPVMYISVVYVSAFFPTAVPVVTQVSDSSDFIEASPI